ncbi:MAG TPA: hypothetical protein VMR33_02820 [Candidatus Baltobacteraceae bacterium]|nr:hypothetical protein [Candidatus Baltobacteraceae bacterium]
MKVWLLMFVSCCLLTGCASENGSPSNGNAAGNVSVASQVAGDYTGQWTASDGGTGKLRVSLKKPADAPWEATVGFTLEGDEASTTMKSVEVNGTHVLLAFGYEVQGRTGAAEMTGELAGDHLEGSYKVTMGEGNPGTWIASRSP